MSDVQTGPVNGMNWVVSLTPIVPAVMSHVKMEEVGDVNRSGSGVELIFAGINAYEQLQISIKSMDKVYDIWFPRLLEALGQSSEGISKSLHAVIFDRLLHTLQIVELSNLDMIG